MAVKLWLASLFFFVAKLGISCHCGIAPAPSFTFFKRDFREGDVFLVQYQIGDEVKIAQHEISAHQEIKLNSYYFRRDGNAYVIGYEDGHAAALLLQKAIAVARSENSDAKNISVRYFRGSSKRSQANAIFHSEKGHPVHYVTPSKGHQPYPVSTDIFDVENDRVLMKLVAR